METKPNSEAIALIEGGVQKQISLTAAQVKGHMALARETIAGVLEPNIHYGMIPGCGKKNVLFKPGAQVLAVAFRLRPSYNVQRIDLNGGHVEYQVTCDLYHIHSGELVGSGMGSCSTMEAKYRFRNAPRTCPKCGKTDTINKSKPEKGSGYYCWSKIGGCGATFAEHDQQITGQVVGKIEYDNPADFYNTVLKQANKRAFIEAVLNTTAAGDAFTQDFDSMTVRARSWLGAGEIEDLPAGSIYDDGVGPPPECKKSKSAACPAPPRNPAPSPEQIERDRVIAKAGALGRGPDWVAEREAAGESIADIEKSIDANIAKGDDVNETLSPKDDALEDIRIFMTVRWPEKSGPDAVSKKHFLKIAFGAASWSKVQGLPEADLVKAARQSVYFDEFLEHELDIHDAAVIEANWKKAGLVAEGD